MHISSHCGWLNYNLFIGIRILQFILLKICLLLGVKVYDGVEFCHLLEPSGDKGWMIETKPPCDASQHQYDIVIEADSKKYTLPGFQMKQFKPKLAIAITVNFVNHNTTAEAKVEECGESRTFRQQFFKDLDKAHGIDLENILYLKDATHYFVMTANKQSLLKRGVLMQVCMHAVWRGQDRFILTLVQWDLATQD